MKRFELVGKEYKVVKVGKKEEKLGPGIKYGIESVSLQNTTKLRSLIA